MHGLVGPETAGGLAAAEAGNTHTLQGFLAYKDPPPPRTLQQACA